MKPDLSLIYGHDPLCGWCYGLIPAFDLLHERYPDLHVDIAVSGLFVGDGAQPYVNFVDYIQNASRHLKSVTGQAPSSAFFELIGSGRAGLANSAAPMLALARVKKAAPNRVATFAHRLQELHYRDGRSMNEIATLQEAAYLSEIALPDMPEYDRVDINHPELSDEIAFGRNLGLNAFPRVYLFDASIDTVRALPAEYEPERFVAMIEAQMAVRSDM